MPSFLSGAARWNSSASTRCSSCAFSTVRDSSSLARNATRPVSRFTSSACGSSTLTVAGSFSSTFSVSTVSFQAGETPLSKSTTSVSSLISQLRIASPSTRSSRWPGGNLHPHLLQLALADLVIERRAGVHHPAADRHQRGVLHKDRRHDLRRPLHPRRPVQLQPFGRADDGLHPRLLVGAGALEGNRRRELDVRLGFVNDHADPAGERRRNAEGKLPARHVAAELRDQFELQRDAPAPRQQHAHRAAFAHQPGLAFRGEGLQRNVFAEQRHDLVGGRGRDWMAASNCATLSRTVPV